MMKKLFLICILLVFLQPKALYADNIIEQNCTIDSTNGSIISCNNHYQKLYEKVENFMPRIYSIFDKKFSKISEKKAFITKFSSKINNISQKHTGNKQFLYALVGYQLQQYNMSLKEKTKEVFLYYHDSKKDPNFQFDAQSISAISRHIPVTQTPIKDTFTLLFSADLNSNELQNGISASPFDTYDFTINSIILREGKLSIDFINNIYLESLSSAEFSLFTHAVKNTAAQFSVIDIIQFTNGISITTKN